LDIKEGAFVACNWSNLVATGIMPVANLVWGFGRVAKVETGDSNIQVSMVYPETIKGDKLTIPPEYLIGMEPAQERVVLDILAESKRLKKNLENASPYHGTNHYYIQEELGEK
jgi:hypothetical protein